MSHYVSSYQSDGNFSQLDVKSSSVHEPSIRLESFRASHPMSGENYKTAAGSSAYALTGSDHLRTHSNQVFRHIMSAAEGGKNPEYTVVLESREFFQEDGGWQVKLRDLDYRSKTYGQMLVCTVTPQQGKRTGNYLVSYEIYDPYLVNGYLVASPLTDAIHKLDARLSDISEENGLHGARQLSHTYHLNLHTPSSETEAFLQSFINQLRDGKYSRFVANMRRFLNLGDLQGKCSHSGENLTGAYQEHVAAKLGYFASAASMVLFGCLFCDLRCNTIAPSFSLWDQSEPMAHVAPSTISPYILAHILDMEVYQLILDKVHSDYRGLRMKQAQGSMLENGAKTIRNAYRANQTLAELAVVFYEPHFANRLK